MNFLETTFIFKFWKVLFLYSYLILLDFNHESQRFILNFDLF